MPIIIYRQPILILIYLRSAIPYPLTNFNEAHCYHAYHASKYSLMQGDTVSVNEVLWSLQGVRTQGHPSDLSCTHEWS